MSTAQLVFGKAKNVAMATLNRPKALNSLTLEMCQTLTTELTSWHAREARVGAFIMKGDGGKAFCAGGDVKSIYEDIKRLENENSNCGSKPKSALGSDFFRYEYMMNYLLGISRVPQVSIWDGIVMGGGVGISIHGNYRVATEKTMFAMPETAIGLFPDVGASAWLPFLPSGFGEYVGLTGCRLGALDLVSTGIATHYVNSKYLEALEAELVAHVPEDYYNASDVVLSILDDFQAKSGGRPEDAEMKVKSELLRYEDQIKNCFEGKECIEEILGSLQLGSATDLEWSKRTQNTLRRMSPMSMLVTLEQFKRGKAMEGTA